MVSVWGFLLLSYSPATVVSVSLLVCHPLSGKCTILPLLPPHLLPMLTRNALTRFCSRWSLDGIATQSAPDSSYCKKGAVVARWCLGANMLTGYTTRIGPGAPLWPYPSITIVWQCQQWRFPKENLNIPFCSPSVWRIRTARQILRPGALLGVKMEFGWLGWNRNK